MIIPQMIITRRIQKPKAEEDAPEKIFAKIPEKTSKTKIDVPISVVPKNRNM